MTMSAKIFTYYFNLITIGCLFLFANARIHHLVLNDDAREQVIISTYGFLKNSFMQVNVNKISINRVRNLDLARGSFAFILEQTKNGGFSSFTANEKNQDFCSLIQKAKPKNKQEVDLNDYKYLSNYLINNLEFGDMKGHSYSMLIFHLDLTKLKVNIIRVGQEMKAIEILPYFKSKIGLNDDDPVNKNENANKTNTDRRLLSKAKKSQRDLFNDIDSPLIDHLDLRFNNVTNSFSFKFQVNINNANEEGLYLLNFFNCFETYFLNNYMSKIASNKTNDIKRYNDDPNKQIVSDFFFYNGINDLDHKFSINLNLDLLERNEDSFLSAGQMPVPTLYLTWSIIYFLAAISWMYIIRSSKEDVFKIHYLMLGLVFIKSISLTFHAINLHYIAMNGRHEAIWAILFYITYVLRGLLLITSILLVGTGWTFIKHVLSENERRLFVIVIPLQILATIAYIFLEEKEEGDAVYLTWRQLFFLVDLLCCGAILFPVVWSIKHLESASSIDGKVATNLRKLKIFKHFYIMIICYVYFTRIIGFLLKQVLPFRYEWFDELCTEVVTFTFFAMTAYKFQPMSNNPYLQVSQSDLIEEEELINANIQSNNNINNNSQHPSLSEFQFNNDAYLSGNTETVLDLIEHNYYSNASNQNNTNTIDGTNLPSGPNTSNPTLFSRKFNQPSNR